MIAMDTARTRRPVAAMLSLALVATFWIPTLSSPASAETFATDGPMAAPTAADTRMTIEVTGVAAPILM